MNKPATRGAFADRLPKAVTFKAWRLAEGQTALPVAVQAATLDDALSAALVAGGLCHKDTLFIRHDDMGRGQSTLHAWAIKRKSQARYVRGPDGCSRAVHDLYPTPLFSLAVDAFRPTPPFDAFKDDPVGVDRSLVSQ